MRPIYAAVLAAGIATLSQGALAHGTEVGKFVSQTGHDVVINSDGKESCLEGVHPVTGSKFRLHVSPRGFVTGKFDGNRVRFMANPKSVAAIRELAAAKSNS